MSAASTALSTTQPARVLITGLQGFTGRHMATELEQNGYEVWGIGSATPGEPRTLEADLIDTASLLAAVQTIQPQYVIHLAGIAFVGHGQPKAFYDINLVGTRNLLEALASVADKLKCVLLASSANVYGNLQSGLLSELNPTNPANDYAVSKLAMEYMARIWIPRIPVVIARPFNYTGVGQSDSFLIPKIISHFVHKRDTIELGNMDVWREFNDVRDVVHAYRKLIEAAPVGQTVNVCSGNLVSLRDALVLASELTGHQLKACVNPVFVRANEVLQLGGDPALLETFVADWHPRPLRETLAWMIAAETNVNKA
ncbi:NAD-dependent epimerase/dehydratase family protein [Achromobacter panacis]|nr:NAD-dependent epimerase/dehydratase family protein [Zwartia panacis]MDN4018059.1 NAD-dependent epimerase/dehydratase family protein [Zwartia panacis]